jgi:hypothetical protein
MALFSLDNSNAASTWQYKTKHVQSRDAAGNDYDAGNFIRGASILICAGPRRKPASPWTAGGGGTAATIFPIGLLQTGSINEQKQLEEVFEIGSERRYFITGRTFFTLQATRIMVDGASLLRAMYNTSTGSAGTGAGDEAGFSDYFTNLASTFFNTPTGLLVIDNDNNNLIVGGAYLEDAYIQTYNRQITAAQTVVAEQCLVKFDKIVPVSKADIDTIVPASALP